MQADNSKSELRFHPILCSEAKSNCSNRDLLKHDGYNVFKLDESNFVILVNQSDGSNNILSNKLEHQRTQTCSPIDDRTQTPEFWL